MPVTIEIPATTNYQSTTTNKHFSPKQVGVGYRCSMILSHGSQKIEIKQR
jgi:hypothetical protein